MVCCTFKTCHLTHSEMCTWNFLKDYCNFIVYSCKMSCAESKKDSFLPTLWNIMNIWKQDLSEFEVTIKLTTLMSFQRNVKSSNAWERPTVLLSESYCSLIFANAIAFFRYAILWGFTHENKWFDIRQSKRKDNSKENILSLKFFAEAKTKGEAGTSVAHCLVELFVVATSK